MLSKTLNHAMYEERDHLGSNIVFDKDRQMAMSVNITKVCEKYMLQPD
jgi:hypothetical protein